MVTEYRRPSVLYFLIVSAQLKECFVKAIEKMTYNKISRQLKNTKAKRMELK